MSGFRKGWTTRWTTRWTRWMTLGAAAALASAMAAPAAAGANCGGEHVVAPGDTLSKIAARCGSSVEALMRANPRITSPARLAVGWRLSVPADGSAGAPGKAGGEAAAARRNQPVELTGRIVNGRRCAMIETADGEAYGVVSPKFAFVNGAVVAISAEIVDDPSCTGPRTLLVHELTKAEPT